MHGGVRVSIGAFNSEEQVEAAIDAVAAITRWNAERRLRSKIAAARG
jgi:hypothetical protein